MSGTFFKKKKINRALTEYFGEECGKDSLHRTFCRDLCENMMLELEPRGGADACAAVEIRVESVLGRGMVRAQARGGSMLSVVWV